MKRFFPLLIVWVLISSCGAPATAPTPTATPDPQQETLNTIIQVAQTVTAEQADQAELDTVNLMRDQSGARAAFADQAEAIFLQIDQDKAAALDEMVNKARGAVNNPLKVSALVVKPGTSGPSNDSLPGKNNYITQSMVQAFMIIGLSTMFSNPNNDTAIGVISEGGDPVGAPGTHYSFQPLFFGSRLEATGTITNIVTTPFPYQETIQYDLSMEACPDAQGDVPIHLTIHSSASLLGGGVQMSVDDQVTGHTNDEGVLVSRDYTSTYEGSRQPIHGVGENLGTVNTSFAYHENVSLNDNPAIPATGTEGYTRQSSEVDAQFNHDVIQEMRFVSIFLSFQALNAAEEKWTTGYCVEIQVPGQGDGVKTVQPNSATPFTAIVRHKFEEVELQVPVIATLSDGQVSVNPSGTKVPAPASFTYKAPPEKDKAATVNLVTRSKRGIATLDVKFKTEAEASFTGEGTYRKSAMNNGVEMIIGYTISITFHATPDGTIEGEGVLQKTEYSQAGQGLLCNEPAISSVVYPPLQVTGTFTPAAAGQPDGTFHLFINNQSSTNTSSWICTFQGVMVQQGPPYPDLGPGMISFDIAATDGAQANGVQDLGGFGGTTGSATWELLIHKVAAH